MEPKCQKNKAKKSCLPCGVQGRGFGPRGERHRLSPTVLKLNHFHGPIPACWWFNHCNGDILHDWYIFWSFQLRNKGLVPIFKKTWTKKIRWMVPTEGTSPMRTSASNYCKNSFPIIFHQLARFLLWRNQSLGSFDTRAPIVKPIPMPMPIPIRRCTVKPRKWMTSQKQILCASNSGKTELFGSY